MCLTCGCLHPDKRYGEEHLITMQDLLDAAAADDAGANQAVIIVEFDGNDAGLLVLASVLPMVKLRRLNGPV